MRDPLNISPCYRDKKLTNFNFTKNSLLNTETCLRDPCIKAFKDGHLGINREARRDFRQPEESSDSQRCSHAARGTESCDVPSSRASRANSN